MVAIALDIKGYATMTYKDFRGNNTHNILKKHARVQSYVSSYVKRNACKSLEIKLALVNISKDKTRSVS